MKKLFGLTVTALILFSLCLTAEELSNKDIVDLVKSGIKADLIKGKIKKSDNMFDVTAKAMVELRNSKVPDDVIEVMLKEAERTESKRITKINVEIQSLASPRREARQAAYLSLLKMGHLSKSRMLKVLTESRDPKVKAALAEAMGKMKIEDSVPYLRILLEDSSPAVRSKSGDSLYMMLDKEECRKLADKGIRKWMPSDENCFAEGYIRMAGNLGDDKDGDFMIRVLEESDRPSERKAAASALANIKNEKAVDILERAMIVDSSSEVRNAAAKTLAVKGNSGSIEAFGKALRKKGSDKAHLFRMLSSFKDKDVIPILITCFGIEELKEEEENVLIDVLRRKTKEDFGNKMAKWLQWWEKNELRLAKDELDKSNSSPEKFRELMKKK
ncbi:MAG: HEAT repeat domain-containing protein [Planctomycetota bacterium]|jgi:hypothetical protein